MSGGQGSKRSFEIDADYSKVFSSLQRLQSNGQLCDVEILVRNGTVHAHKVVLAAVIPFFKTMFTGNMQEARSYQIICKVGYYLATDLFLTGIDHDTLVQLVLHVYGHSLVVSEGNVQALLVAADFLQLQRITEKCSMFLTDHVLCYYNALGIRELFSALGHSSRVLEVEEFIERNFLPISFTEEFIMLPIDKLVELLSRDKINVVEEENVFKAAARWIEHCPARAKVAFRYRSFTVGVCNYEGIFVNGIKYDQLTKKWTGIAKITIPRNFPSVAVNDKKIYVVGGHVRENFVSDVEYYDTVKNKWRKIYDPKSSFWEEGTSMRTSRHLAAVAVLNEYIYVIGGRNGGEALSSVERFCTEKYEWEAVPDMHESRYFFGATAVNGKIYVFGGLNTNGIQSRSVECFNPRNMCWTILPAMPMAGRISLAVSHNNLVFLTRIGSRRIHIFNVDTNEWEQSPEMPAAISTAVIPAICIPAE
ncbi:BTB/POZ domain protein [Necator americanus]|uniref:BTB/POZ domain protein n=1 Tax=Necator americanus TaxID=51031 RepID=W2SX24_NECAM|nr:BTB/POZ domain protein [Necator americanus]ETN74073.1 BTB/POZ domain protein [Necator americanus]